MESLFVAFAVLLLVMFFLGLGVWVFAALLLVSTDWFCWSTWTCSASARSWRRW